MYLSSVNIKPQKIKNYPFNLPIFKNGLSINFKTPITFILGENGSGKSTFLESLAYNAGFNVLGGNKNHSYTNAEIFDNIKLADEMELKWNLKTSLGFFFRAESFINFTGYIENLALENGKIAFSPYGGKSLQKLSHGEAFLSLFQNKFKEGLFILDEPESALSIERQFALISILNQLTNSGKCQFIIATHSPILITMPNATVYEIENNSIYEKKYDETKQFQLYKQFINHPEQFLKHLTKKEPLTD